MPVLRALIAAGAALALADASVVALALADPDDARADDARAFRTAHGVDPRSTDGLLDILGITLG